MRKKTRDEKIIRMYVEDKKTLRSIASELGTNHHNIKRTLLRNGINIDNTNRIREPLTEAHKEKISKATKGRKVWSEGKKMSVEHVLKNMAGHIKYEVDYLYYQNFKDVEKLKVLNHMLTRDRVSQHFDTSSYKSFIEKFYHDEQFNKIYAAWMENGCDRWYKPSLDHKIPLSKGGTYDLDNLQILTWFENRTKKNMMPEQWREFREKTNTSSNLFI